MLEIKVYFLPWYIYSGIILTTLISTVLSFYFFKRKKKEWYFKAYRFSFTFCAWASCYLLIEILYNVFTFNLKTGNPGLLPIIDNLNTYFLNRSYQWPLLILLIFILFPDKKARMESFIHFGDVKAPSDLTQNKRSWFYFLNFWIIAIVFSALFMIYKKSAGITLGRAAYYSLIPLFLGAMNNSIIEEVLFRGVLLSRFSEVLGPVRGNLLQAVLFSFMHFNLELAGAKLIMQTILFLFLGWFWGKSTLQTKGIFVPFIMHSTLVMAMWVIQLYAR
ncbi:MAG: CPBP family intramembrane metalloprotease [Firmicutes bacterium]|nr:CPBP family intramembrane metalloprotease [Bacillota bacterium]